MSGVAASREWWAPPLGGHWPDGFVGSCCTWLDKLQRLLEQSGRDCSHLDHTRQLVRDELPEYLPSGESLRSKIRRIRENACRFAGQSILPDADAAGALDDVIAAAFPGSSAGIAREGANVITRHS